MKKIFILIVVLMIPIMVFADEAPPDIRYLYEVKIIKDGGSDCSQYRDSIHLDKGEIVKVYGETTRKNKDYLLVLMEDETMCELLKEDTALVSDVVDPKDTTATEVKEKNTFLIMQDGVEILKGPSSSYDVVKTIDKGVYNKITYIYDAPYDSASYIYVEIDGVKGWINNSKYNVYIPYYAFIIGKDSKSTCELIPANTIIENAWIRLVYNKEEIDQFGNTSYSNSETKIVFKYNDCINEFEEFKEVNSFVSLVKDKKTLTTNKEIELYEDKSNEKVIMKIPSGEKVTQISTKGSGNMTLPSMYVEYDGTKGWVMNNSFEEPVLDDHSNYIDAKGYEDIYGTGINNNNNNNNNNNSTDTKNNVMICVLIAICIALTAIVVIILINRKKDNNEKNI